MPPWPRSSRISSCGKCCARSEGGGGGKSLGPLDAVGSGCVSSPALRRHCGQRPCGASEASFVPQPAQTFSAFIYVPTCYRRENWERLHSLIAKGGEEVANLLLDLGRAGDGLGDFCAEHLAVAFAQAVHGYLEGRLSGAEGPGHFGIGRAVALAGKEHFHLFEFGHFAILGKLLVQASQDMIQ